MKAKSIKGSSVEEIKNELSQSRAEGFKPTLAIVFISVKQDREAVSKLLDENGIQIFGATSCGEFINDYQSEGEIVILLLDINRNNFSILFETISNRTLQDAASHLAQAALEKFGLK